MGMFRKRAEPPALVGDDARVQAMVLGGVTAKYSLYRVLGETAVKRSLNRGSIAIDLDKSTKRSENYLVPEHYLINRKKTVEELLPHEADYFAAKMLDLDVVIEPVAEGVLDSPLVCVYRSTGAWCCPTIDWKLASALKNKMRISAIHRTVEKVVEASTAYATVTRPSLCEAVVMAALTLNEKYEINYDGARDSS